MSCSAHGPTDFAPSAKRVGGDSVFPVRPTRKGKMCARRRSKKSSKLCSVEAITAANGLVQGTPRPKARVTDKSTCVWEIIDETCWDIVAQMRVLRGNNERNISIGSVETEGFVTSPGVRLQGSGKLLCAT